MASTYLHKGSNKSSTPCGKYAKSDNGIKYQFVFIRDGDGDDDDDDGGDDDDDDDDHVHGSYIDLHIESPPTWHFINTQPFRDSSNVKVAPKLFQPIVKRQKR